MRKSLAALTMLVVTLAAFPASGDEPAKKSGEDQGSIWMKQKLSASQFILAGLTKGDFDAIDKNASSMLTVAYFEQWFRSDMPNYKTMMKDFEYANKALMLAAREKNLDGATLAYMQQTVSCVNCHKIVRDVKK
jgi:cytochrome c556